LLAALLNFRLEPITAAAERDFHDLSKKPVDAPYGPTPIISMNASTNMGRSGRSARNRTPEAQTGRRLIASRWVRMSRFGTKRTSLVRAVREPGSAQKAKLEIAIFRA